MTAPTAPDTWYSRDYPVLVAAVTHVNAHPTDPYITLGALANATGLEHEEVWGAVNALQDAGLIECQFLSGQVNSFVTKIRGAARVLTGAWPSEETFADRLIATVDAMEQNATTDEERTRLQRLRAALASAGRDLVVSIAASVISGQIPR